MSAISKYNVELSLSYIKPKTKEITAWLENGKSVISSTAKKWVEAHHPIYQKALSIVIENTKRVSFKMFRSNLMEVTKRFNEAMDKEKDHSYVILVEPRKSNQWVAEVAREHLKYQPSQCLSLGDKGAKDFLEYLDRLPQGVKPPKKIVLFDDASYSGKQLTDHVKSIFASYAIVNKKVMPKVYIIVPFATNYARDRLNAMSFVKTGNLSVFTRVMIDSVADVLEKEEVDLLSELYNWTDDPIESQGRGVFYFDHKIPNGVSSIESIADGTVREGIYVPKSRRIPGKIGRLLPMITPPYKQEEKEHKSKEPKST